MILACSGHSGDVDTAAYVDVCGYALYVYVYMHCMPLDG